ncbi:MAG: biotin transporter BioY [bacterium]|nr:biotin transporter BioY [bacterium]
MLNLFSPYDAYRGENTSFFSYFSYIPQVPAVFFIAALLGPVGGMIAVFIYIAAGLIGFPVFSSGGGLSYFLKPGMGYLLGFFPAIFFVSNILRKKNIKHRFVAAALSGIICVHIIGIIYLTILMFFQGEQLFLILSWFWLLTGMQILYDFIFGILAIFLARFFRRLLSIITD